MSSAKSMIITVDGPSGAGKGTLCQLLAKKLGFQLLDSGALYRITALAAEKEGVNFDDASALQKVAAELDVSFSPVDAGVSIRLQGVDVSRDIRQEHVGMNASKVAACVPVREALLQRQRDFACAPGLVADGRDMGTTVFPDAQVKVFLTASADERARRRVKQLEESGVSADFQQIKADIEARDKQDRERTISPLKPAANALQLDSTQLSIDQVLAEVLALVDLEQ